MSNSLPLNLLSRFLGGSVYDADLCMPLLGMSTFNCTFVSDWLSVFRSLFDTTFCSSLANNSPFLFTKKTNTKKKTIKTPSICNLSTGTALLTWKFWRTFHNAFSSKRQCHAQQNATRPLCSFYYKSKQKFN